MVGQFCLAVLIEDGLPEQTGNGLRFGGQHGGLIHHADTLQITERVETGRVFVAESIEEEIGAGFSPDDPGKVFGFAHIAHNHGGSIPAGAGKRGPHFLVIPFAVYDHGIPVPTNSLTLVPDLLDKRACRVIGHGVDPVFGQLALDVERGAEGWNDHYVIGGELLERNQLFAGGRPQETHAGCPQIAVHARIVNHLRKQENAPSGILLQCAPGNVDSMLDTEAKPEMPGDLEA